MKNLLLLAIISLMTNYCLFAQEKINLKEIFLEAEDYILYEDYPEALALYLKLVSNNHNNAYINHRIGECYLQIPGKKDKAIAYLEEASKQMSVKIKEGNFKETNAPLRTLFYLGDAYQVNNFLDKAILAYKRFEELQVAQGIYNMDYVNQQIESCKYAKDLISNPIKIQTNNLGNVINNEFSNEMPVVSPDENAMVYISRLKFYDAIYYTEKINGEWSKPVNIAPQLKSDNDFYPCYLSLDKKTLLLSKNEDFNEDIFISNFINGKWQVPLKLNKNINSKFWESHASMSNDGKIIYFVSDRKDGFGGLDIYKSVFDETKNDWGEAKNLGPEINTPLNEECPKLSEDGQTLFFSSQCHYNMGGYDIFYSKKINKEEWSAPINIGYPINTTDDDLFFYPVKNGDYAYSAILDKNGFGQKDIVRVEFEKSENIALVNVRGNICPSNPKMDISFINIVVDILDSDKDELLQTITLDDTQFSVELPTGNYTFVINSPTYKKQTKRIVIPENYTRKDLVFNIKMSPVDLKTNKFISIK